MKPVLALFHVPHEELGTIRFYLERKKCPIEVCRPYRGDVVPLRARRYSWIIIMGGPMSANDGNRYPFLNQELRLIEDAVTCTVPVLGICLGAQLIAKSLGGRVYPGAKKEIGWYPIRPSREGREDHVTSTFREPWSRYVFHWHGETFDLPRGAMRLASSNLFKNQAFRYGRSVYAFQFHMEMTYAMITEWLGLNAAELKRERRTPELCHIIDDSLRYIPTLQQSAAICCERMFSDARSYGV